LSQRFKYIIYEKPNENYARIILNRPEVMNALNVELRQELIEALDLIENDQSTRALVLTGAGDKAFSAGADINIFREMSPFQAKKYLRISKGASNKIENLSKPVIAAVNGYAMGGGLELAMSCDIIIASDNARFAQSEINIGFIPGVGGTQRLPRIVGSKRAKELIFTGDLIDAQEAFRIGLVNRVVPKSELMSTVESLIVKICQKSPIALRLAKEAINKSLSGLSQGLDYESALFSFAFSTNDQKEGAAAFLEKRKPTYTGS
jgi:enoyl-CoA hydratase